MTYHKAACARSCKLDSGYALALPGAGHDPMYLLIQRSARLCFGLVEWFGK